MLTKCLCTNLMQICWQQVLVGPAYHLPFTWNFLAHRILVGRKVLQKKLGDVVIHYNEVNISISVLSFWKSWPLAATGLICFCSMLYGSPRFSGKNGKKWCSNGCLNRHHHRHGSSTDKEGQDICSIAIYLNHPALHCSFSEIPQAELLFWY